MIILDIQPLLDRRSKQDGVNRSWAWLADQIGVTTGAIYRMRDGKANGLRFDPTLERLCQVLSCEPGDLIRYIPPKKKRRAA